MIKRIIKGIIMSAIILIIAIIVSVLIKLFQVFCPILFIIFAVVIVLGTGFFFANILWQ